MTKRFDTAWCDVFLGKSLYIVLPVLLILFIAGMFYSFFLEDVIRYSDERLYFQLSTNLASLGTFSVSGEAPSAIRPPGYPFFMSLIFLLGGELVHVRIIQFLILSLTGFMTYLLFSQLERPIAGVITAILLPCYPVMFYTGGTFYPQTLGAALFVLVWYILATRRGIVGSVLAGFAFGCLVLVLPAFVAVAPLFLWFFRDIRVQSGLRMVCFVCVASLVVAPWLVRNYETFDRFVFVSASSGLMLILGNSEFAKANAGPNTNIGKYTSRARVEAKSDADYDAALRSQALNWIWENKIRAIRLYVSKLLNHFNYRNELATTSEKSALKDLVMFITYYPLLVLSVLRAIRLRREDKLEIRMIIMYIVFAFVSAVFFTRIRYRLPLDWLLICLSAAYLESVMLKSRKRSAAA